MSVSDQQRNTIREWAENCCEFCRIAESNRFVKFQIDHVIPIKHGGGDETINLCLACIKCNGYKGPNVAALDPNTGNATKLFNPRQQDWHNTSKLTMTQLYRVSLLKDVQRYLFCVSMIRSVLQSD